MSSNPVLIELLRGKHVESRHRGAYAVYDGRGERICGAGEVNMYFFPRSAIKLLYSLSFLETGASEYYDLTAKEIALSASSHVGEDTQIKYMLSWMKKIDISMSDLQCGVHSPFSRTARKHLESEGHRPHELHNNNSGRHLSLLSICRFLGLDIGTYTSYIHPVQRLVRQSVERRLEVKLDDSEVCIERCGLPTYPIPLAALAQGMARVTVDSQIAPSSSRKLLDSISSEPDFLGGPHKLSSTIIRATAGDCVVKGGSEGVFAGLLRSKNLGFSLKIEDGSQRAADVLLCNILAKLDPNLLNFECIRSFIEPDIRAYDGRATGKLIASI